MATKSWKIIILQPLFLNVFLNTYGMYVYFKLPKIPGLQVKFNYPTCKMNGLIVPTLDFQVFKE